VAGLPDRAEARFDVLLRHQRLPSDSRLPAKVKKRLLWQLFSDLTYLSQRRRTLDRIGKATLSVPWGRVVQIAARLLPNFREHFGMQGLELPVLTQWLWGTLTHMRQRGGALHPTLGNYAADGNVWALKRTGGRGDWMPGMGQSTPRPVMLTLGRQTGFDRLTGSSRTTWYKQWALAVLGHQTLMDKQLAADLYGTAFDAMIADGILARTAHHQGDTLAINDTDLAFLTTDGNKRRLAVPRQNADHLRNMPCLDAIGSRYHNVTPTAGDWWARRFSKGSLRRVVAAEHTGLLVGQEREALEIRFKDQHPKPWYENLLSATPTLEMGVDIGDLSSVLSC
jgi:DEAD/DEAH box helicase domain-containing protein